MIKRMTGEHINELALIEKQIFGIQNAEKTLSKELENKISAYFIAEESGKISVDAVEKISHKNAENLLDL